MTCLGSGWPQGAGVRASVQPEEQGQFFQGHLGTSSTCTLASGQGFKIPMSGFGEVWVPVSSEASTDFLRSRRGERGRGRSAGTSAEGAAEALSWQEGTGRRRPASHWGPRQEGWVVVGWACGSHTVPQSQSIEVHAADDACSHQSKPDPLSTIKIQTRSHRFPPSPPVRPAQPLPPSLPAQLASLCRSASAQQRGRPLKNTNRTFPLACLNPPSTLQIETYRFPPANSEAPGDLAPVRSQTSSGTAPPSVGSALLHADPSHREDVSPTARSARGCPRPRSSAPSRTAGRPGPRPTSAFPFQSPSPGITDNKVLMCL